MEDRIMQEEQAHLSEVYAKLLAIRDDLDRQINVTQAQAAQDLRDMSEEIRPDFGGTDEAMETLAAIETLNAVIDAYNQSHDFTLEKLRRTLLLLARPYFAKVRLRMRAGADPMDVYIGPAGIMDADRNQLVVDWRSPIAQTYYNQEMGRTSYEVGGKRRTVELELRRQFDILRDHLNTYFDTTVAIQDSLLLEALRRDHTQKLQDITATIQREQNEVVRHEDVPVLLVNGIAGSGKTSVLLQRIAFLLYRERDTLNADQVMLLSPNDVFSSYIDQVLPSLGEANPQVFTWSAFLAQQGVGGRGEGRETTPGDLALIGTSIPQLSLMQRDFRAIEHDGVTLLKPSQVLASVNKFVRRFGLGPRAMALVKEDLHKKLETRLDALSKTDDVREEMLGLDLDAQIEILGEVLAPDTEDETAAHAKRYTRWLHGEAHDRIEAAEWLRIDRIGCAITGKPTISSVEWLYLRSSLLGASAPRVRFVMVDEVQDYTAAQLMVLSACFPRAHFLLLGDEHQAIFRGSATFEQVREIFAATHERVDEAKLLTSYRSSPEITELFSGLLSPEEAGTLSSVRDAGVMPRVFALPQDADGYLEGLGREVERAAAEGGLCAVICDDRRRAEWIARKVPGVSCLGRTDQLPASGVVAMDLALAKGLEFDQVIVADASAEVYPATPLARRRLYTAISRAMHRVSVVSQGSLTPLLDFVS